MNRKTKMGLGTINTILNTAPLIIQGATRLVKLINERNRIDKDDEIIPVTMEDLGREIDHLHKRIDAGYESDLEQIKLVEELARQNELLATSLKKTGRQLMVIAGVLCLTLVLVLVLLYKILFL